MKIPCTPPLIPLLSILAVGFVGCGSAAKTMEPLQAMVGSYKFSGFTIADNKREEILGKTTQVITPDQQLLMHFEQSQVFPEEAFAVFRYDADQGHYTMSWESNRMPDKTLVASGDFDAKGRLVLDGTLPTLIYDREDEKKVGTMVERPCQYILTFPMHDRFILTVRFPMDRNASYTNFRMLAIRHDGPPDAEAFQKSFDERKAATLRKP